MNQSHREGPANTIHAELQHLIEANETTRILIREACASLLGAIELHLDQTDAQLRRLAAASDELR